MVGWWAKTKEEAARWYRVPGTSVVGGRRVENGKSKFAFAFWCLSTGSVAMVAVELLCSGDM